jgi:azurin/glucose/arabinose dehydrogenase
MTSAYFSRSFLASVFLSLIGSVFAAEPLCELKKGDHLAIVGSGLADRQQHHGWFEALIHKAYPDADLTIRNLGFAADEINLHPRSQDVPPTEWFLAMKKGDSTPPGNAGIIYKAGTDFGADVIFAYWGFNESFRGPEGLAEFKNNLDQYIGKMQAANFSGKGAPRLVFFSPIAQEDLKDPNYSDGAKNNVNLALYTQAMAEVCKAKNVPFVDLFEPSKAIFDKTEKVLTINGVHLTEEGDKLLAPVQFKAVFGKEPAATTDKTVVKIRDAVLLKNAEWHHRYRTVDQFNIYGDRSRIAYEGVTNAKILGQEMAQRDVKTENRDKLVWAVAKGLNFTVADDNLPPVDLTPPNRKNAVPYVDPDKAVELIERADGCRVELVASEKNFPELINPVQMNFDTKGRLWIAAWPSYPETMPTTKVFDKLLVFDLDPKTGKAVKCTTFADGLNCPTGFQFYKDGVLVMQSPDLVFLRDTDGDGKADTKERVLHGLDAADSHHETNSMCLEPGGAVYLSDGVFHRTNVETFNGPIRNTDGAIYRYEPRSGKFMRHMPYGFANPHGRVFDYWGNDLITDGTGNDNYFGPAASGHLDSGAHGGMKTFWGRPSRPCAGTSILTSRHFPDDWQGIFLNCNVISAQSIFRAKISEDGSGLKAETLSELVTTDVGKNPNFRPSGVAVAPDGSVYFMDWSQMLIGHLQHHLRDPNRDHAHGRLYRVTYEGRPLLVPKKIDGQPIAALLELLKEPENDVRMRAKIELGKLDSKKVTDGVNDWVKLLDPKEATYEHNMLEALWVHQWHNIVNVNLLKRVLKSPEPRARAQGVRVLGYWRDRLPDALALLKVAADDEAPRVRLEAVRVASFFRDSAAADAALTILKHPLDYYLDYCFKETMRQLEPWWKNAVAEGKQLAMDNPAGINYILGSVGGGDLHKLPKSAITFTAMLTRDGVPKEHRAEALTEMAKLKNASVADTLVDTLASVANTPGSSAADLCALLLQLPAADLKSIQPKLQKIAAAEASEVVAQSTAAAIIVADGQLDPAWKGAQKSPAELIAFLNCLPKIPDAQLRAKAYEPVKSLFTSLPVNMEATLKNVKGTSGRFVRIQLPRNGTLSLAEVQVFSAGKNIAPAGTATQQSTAFDGDPKRAIDGNTSGDYNQNSVTHTSEGANQPWWEVDLQSEEAIESVVVWNRTGGDFGGRLEGFDLVILDAGRHEIFKKSANKAPMPKSDFAFEGNPAGGVRRAAIRAIAGLGVEPAAVFSALANLIKKNDQVPSAVQAIAGLPESAWSVDQSAVAVGGILAWAKTIPSEARTAAEYTNTIATANKLIAKLPAAESAAATKALANLNVRVITIKTVREQMRYDIPRLVVEAGRDFELNFINEDAMPHNIVFVQPGTMQAVAEAAQVIPPTKLDSKGRAYIPENDARIFAASKLIEAGQRETLRVAAPEKEGTYQYVCTFPGHWTIMKGEMIVTKDVEAYLKAHPEK